MINLNQYREPYSRRDKLLRRTWWFVNATIFRCMLGGFFSTPRNLLLRLFGADIFLGSLVYPTCKIWAPWNLKIGKYACIGPKTELYNKAPILLGDNVVVSQGAFLCTASHDINSPQHSLLFKPIILKDYVWVAADAFIGMGVTIGEGAVVGARACVFKDVESWTVVGGNPSKFIKKRMFKE